MPAIIYQTTPTGLYATGERTVTTYQSGLVRVDQTFVCSTANAATHRAALADGNNMPGGSTPSISGLKIFPDPVEKKRPDGFTEFNVTAYGRINTTGNRVDTATITKTRNFTVSSKAQSHHFVITGAFDPASATPPSYPAQSTLYYYNNQTYTRSGSWVISGLNIVNYGYFSEVSFQWETISLWTNSNS